MSINNIILDKPKPWLDARVNSLKVDDNLDIAGDISVADISASELTVSGQGSFSGNLFANAGMFVGIGGSEIQSYVNYNDIADFIVSNNPVLLSDGVLDISLTVIGSPASTLYVMTCALSGVSPGDGPFITNDTTSASVLTANALPIVYRPNNLLEQFIAVKDSDGAFKLGLARLNPAGVLTITICTALDTLGGTFAAGPNPTDSDIGPTSDFTFSWSA
jgi:hypothetical protein